MHPIYLYVPPEDYAKVESRGAKWDEQTKRWFIGAEADAKEFAPWLPSETEEGSGGPFELSSEHAFVVTTSAVCQQCRARIDVICIYCDSGVDAQTEEVLERFSVSYIAAMNDTLVRQLEAWPQFKLARSSLYPDLRYFANHCAHCGAPQEDDALHSEPGGAFFDISGIATSTARTALAGRVELNADTKTQL